MAHQAGQDLSDESLMALVEKGDRQAFSHLLRRHSATFFRVAWRFVGDEGEAEDVVQEAFLKLWDKPDSYKPRPGVKFTSWFYRVVSNAALDRVRKRKRVAVNSDYVDYVADDRAGQDSALIEQHRRDALEAAIAALPDKQKMALNLCFYEGVSNKEAAAIIGVKVKALESLLMRAKSNIKDHIKRAGLWDDEQSA